jgi:uncharacterized RDD family membrane protein YckC
VVLDVEVTPAGWGRRATAAALDAIFILVLWYGIAIALAIPFLGSGDRALYIALVVGFVVAYIVYSALALRLGRRRGGAQTPGKRIAGLAVVTRDGTAPTLWHLVFRELVAKATVFGWIGGSMVFPFLLDIVWPVRGGDRAALHDKLARTRVVRVTGVAVVEPGLDAVPVMSPS